MLASVARSACAVGRERFAAQRYDQKAVKYIEVIRLEDKIKATEFSEDAFEEAKAALASIKSAVHARTICQAMSETWQERVLPFGRELLEAKRADQRERGLELLAYVADVSLVAEVEAAKARERSKTLLSTYDFTVRRIRKAYERKNPAADPLDLNADPVARMQALSNLPYEELWALTGIRERYWGHLELPVLAPDAGADAIEKAEAKRLRRLTSFLRSGWTQPYWLAQLLYIAHPDAGSSGTQLVWQAQRGRTWVSFRGRADVSGQPIEIEATAQVRLAHPAELSTSELAVWSELARREEWSYSLGQLDTPVHDDNVKDAVEAMPALDERRARAWLAEQGLEPVWEHEHRAPHATLHVLATDDNKPWLRLHHDAIVGRRTGSKPIRVKKIEGPKSKRQRSETVRLLRDLGEHASAD